MNLRRISCLSCIRTMREDSVYTPVTKAKYLFTLGDTFDEYTQIYSSAIHLHVAKASWDPSESTIPATTTANRESTLSFEAGRCVASRPHECHEGGKEVGLPDNR